MQGGGEAGRCMVVAKKKEGTGGLALVVASAAAALRRQGLAPCQNFSGFFGFFLFCFGFLSFPPPPRAAALSFLFIYHPRPESPGSHAWSPHRASSQEEGHHRLL